MRRVGVVAAALAALGSFARADDGEVPAPTRGVHGSVGGGGALLLAGADGGSRLGVAAELDVLPGGALGRWGGLVALRAARFDGGQRRGLAMVGVVYEGAASRPRLALDLHGDLGLDLARTRPLAGGGLRTTLGLVGPLGIALDAGLYVVVAGYATRAVVDTSLAIVARW